MRAKTEKASICGGCGLNNEEGDHGRSERREEGRIGGRVEKKGHDVDVVAIYRSTGICFSPVIGQYRPRERALGAATDGEHERLQRPRTTSEGALQKTIILTVGGGVFTEDS